MEHETIIRDSAILHSNGDQDSVKLAEEWFKNLQGFATKIDVNRKSTSKRSKIAILDTGMDIHHAGIATVLNKNVKEWKGFPDDPLKDPDGHGTFLACVLMRTAPHAWLYIARIFDDTQKFTDDEVAKAIDWASQRADVISISWGMGGRHSQIDDALNRAVDNGAVIVAAAPNRTYLPMTFPAKHPKVFCIGSAYGDGRPTGANPAHSKTKFCALGEGVRVDWKIENSRNPQPVPAAGQYRYDAGTSTATVIAAGIASLFIDYIRQISDYGRGSGNFESMQKLFLAMSEHASGQEYRFLAPWSLLQGTDYKENIKQIISVDLSASIISESKIPNGSSNEEVRVLGRLEKQPPSNRFIDRGGNILENMAQILERNRQIIISGSAGMGKSELIKQFIWRICDSENPKYATILWIYADTESLCPATLELARDLGIDPSDQATGKQLWKEILQQRGSEDSWLLVFDNLENVEEFKRLALVDLKNVHMVVTTRHSNPGLIGEHISLEPIDLEHAKQVFRAEYDARSRGNKRDFDDQELTDLIEAIGTHPSTVCQVISFFQYTTADIRGFLKDYKRSAETREEFWTWGTQESPPLVNQLSSVFRKTEENLSSLRLLCLFSCFHGDNIPSWLLRPNPWLAQDSFKRTLEQDLNRASGLLTTWSIITRTKSGFSIQNVFQECIRSLMNCPTSEILAKLDERERSVRYWTSRASELLYPRQGRFAWSSFTDQLEIAKQTEYCMKWCSLYGVDCAVNEALIESFAAYVCLYTGHKHEPKWWSKVIQQYNNISEPAGIKEGLLCHFMSLRWFLLKDYKKALVAAQRALETAKQLGEQEKMWRLPCNYQLGLIHREQGNHEDAARCFQKLIDFSQEPSYTRLIALLEASFCNGDRQAESLLDANSIAMTVLSSKTNADASLPLILIGALKIKQGRVEEGLKECKHALKMFQLDYGVTHLRGSILVEVVARTFRDLGEHALALEWLENVTPLVDAIYQKQTILGASTLESLAVSLCCEEVYDKAWQTLRKLREVRQRFSMAIDNGTPSNLGVDEEVSRLCVSLQLQERYEEARNLCQCAVSQLRKEPMVPRQAFARARQQVTLASIYERQPKVDLIRAATELKEALDPLRQELGDANEEVRKVRDDFRRINGILESWKRPETPPDVSPNESEVEVVAALVPVEAAQQQVGVEVILMGALVIGFLLLYEWYRWF